MVAVLELSDEKRNHGAKPIGSPTPTPRFGRGRGMLVGTRRLSHAISPRRLRTAPGPAAWFAGILLFLAIRPARASRKGDGLRTGHARRRFVRSASPCERKFPRPR